MGSLLVEIGQCGCQIGMKLHQYMDRYPQLSYLRRPKNDVYHTIMLDTEPKILKPIIQDRKKYAHLDPLNIKYFQYGRGNNWSYGYLDLLKYKNIDLQDLEAMLNTTVLTQTQAPIENNNRAIKIFSKLKPTSFTEKYFLQNSQILQFTLDAARKQIEKTDCFLGVHLICSLGGGTGSGLGTRVVQQIRDHMNTRIFAHTILPNQSGETPLQHYNCALSLASLYEHTDAIFTYQNDKMTSLFEEQATGSLDQINRYIAHCIGSLIRLNDAPKYGRFCYDLIQECVVAPELKFLELYASYEADHKEKLRWTWDNAMENTLKQVVNANRDDFGKNSEAKEKTLHMEVVCRGKDDPEFEKHEKRFRTLFKPINETISFEDIDKKNPQKDCIVVAGRTRVLRYLRYIMDRGSEKLRVGAYTWNYKVPIEPAFEKLAEIIDNYESI